MPFLTRVLWRARLLAGTKLGSRFSDLLADAYPKRHARIPLGPIRGTWWDHTGQHQFLMALGVYEPETAAWIADNLRQGDAFFDVGANAGYMVAVGVRAVGPSGKVFAFEPVKSNATHLQELAKNNGWSNVWVQGHALADVGGSTRLVIPTRSANAHLVDTLPTHFAPTVLESSTIEEVVQESLDHACVRLGCWPDVVKIDVEGAEMKVLAGADAVLRRGRARLIVSTHSMELRREVAAFLRGYGYSVAPLEGFEHELVAIRPHEALLSPGEMI